MWLDNLGVEEGFADLVEINALRVEEGLRQAYRAFLVQVGGTLNHRKSVPGEDFAVESQISPNLFRYRCRRFVPLRIAD